MIACLAIYDLVFDVDMYICIYMSAIPRILHRLAGSIHVHEM